MKEPRSSRSDFGHDCGPSKRCPECTAGLFPPSDDWHHPSTYDLRCSNEVVWHYPRQPWWWDGSGNEDRRRAVIDEFDQSNLAMLTQEIAQEIDHQDIDSPDEAGGFVRRLLAFCWQIEVARQWLAAVESRDPREMAVWQLEIKHAVRVSELGWRFLRDLPFSLIATGLIDATSRSFEIVSNDDLD